MGDVFSPSDSCDRKPTHEAFPLLWILVGCLKKSLFHFGSNQSWQDTVDSLLRPCLEPFPVTRPLKLYKEVLFETWKEAP